MPTSNVLTVAGTVLFREKLAMPPGGVVTVKLVDTTGEVLAGTFVDAENGPTEFALHADPDDVADPRKLLLWARLRSDAGVWGTTEMVPVADDPTVPPSQSSWEVPPVVVTRIDG